MIEKSRYYWPQKYLSRTLSITVYIALTAIAWSLLYHFNQSIFETIKVNQFITWIFLPAFIRMLAVMIFGFPGALGLMLGAFITRDISSVEWMQPLFLSLISGLAPYLSMLYCQRAFGLPTTLRGLHPQHLFVFAFAGSVTSAGLNHFYFYFSSLDCNMYTFITMLVGDFIGTLLMLYLAALVSKSIAKQLGIGVKL